jgi:hypothetical protein
MKITSVKSRKKVMASLSRLSVSGSAKDLKVSWHLVEAGHTSTSWLCGNQMEMNGLTSLGLKTTMRASFLVWTSKPGMRPTPDAGDGVHMAPS